ncbi:MAG TPA: hypothetical protein VIK69_11815 [Methylophilaceae bacterium]
MMTPDDNDLHRVRFEHEGVHERLINWARWCNSGRGGPRTSPMFRGYKAAGFRNAVDELRVPVDDIDAQMIEKIVFNLPVKHRDVMRWYYVYSRRGIGVSKAAKALAVRPADMSGLVHDARAMVKRQLDMQSTRGTIAPQFDPA